MVKLICKLHEILHRSAFCCASDAYLPHLASPGFLKIIRRFTGSCLDVNKWIFVEFYLTSAFRQLQIFFFSKNESKNLSKNFIDSNKNELKRSLMKDLFENKRNRFCTVSILVFLLLSDFCWILGFAKFTE